MFHPLESETLRRMDKMGIKVDALLNPVIALPASLVGTFSKPPIVEAVEKELGCEDKL